MTFAKLPVTSSRRQQGLQNASRVVLRYEGVTEANVACQPWPGSHCCNGPAMKYVLGEIHAKRSARIAVLRPGSNPPTRFRSEHLLFEYAAQLVSLLVAPMTGSWPTAPMTPGVQNSSAEQTWLIVSVVSLGQLRVSVQKMQKLQYIQLPDKLQVLLSCDH